MKRMTYFVMALALVLGLAQCKKEQTTTSNTGESVFITLNVGDNNNGTRVNVNPTGTDQVTFEDGDQILVAYDGKYVGTLERSNSQFSGNITITQNGKQPLYFYFLGNKQDNNSLTAGSTTTCTVNISDQTTSAGLPVISMGKSTVNYSSDVTSYSSRLYNKASLMKFTVTTPSSAAICITGMNNIVTVDFTDPTDNGFTYGKDGDGLIKEPAKDANNVTWAVVLPQGALEAGAEGSVYTAGNAYTGTRPAMDAIAMNTYLNDGVALSISTVSVPTGAINGKFTINANHDTVYFSQGNLQYQASTNTWQFAEHQYDYVGSANSAISQTNSGWIDLFGWGTSGYNHNNAKYNPWEYSTNNGEFYAYGDVSKNLYDEDGKADWGYNAISNGGNQENSGWRTLTIDEWRYLSNVRTTSSGIRWTRANVGNVNGIILLPDNWSTDFYTLNNANGGAYAGNTITAEDWANKLEANGAAFLPAAGYRQATTVRGPGSEGSYRSATAHNASFPWGLYFNGGNYFDMTGGFMHCGGSSVRLVRNVE